jgi:hypothetical protein
MAMVDRADISKADKAEVLQRLYNHAVAWKTLPMVSALTQATLQPMSIEQARRLVVGRNYFDYVNGKKIAVDLAQPVVTFFVYDRECGAGAARQALEGVAGVVFLGPESVGEVLNSIRGGS